MARLKTSLVATNDGLIAFVVWCTRSNKRTDNIFGYISDHKKQLSWALNFWNFLKV